ncbi:MAG: phosphosulfolactate synthase [Bacteroidetes bacterium]|jgi:phosphosulfolactate synthase|nr:phosphosulfolactate synthase [Bacteroidota bacterium]
MNFEIPQLPYRAEKPRKEGLTMVLDTGLSMREAEDLMSVGAEYIDFVKFGWTTAAFAPNLKERIRLYREAGCKVYFGGTLFEVFAVRNALDQYKKILDTYGMTHLEISDGSMELTDERKAAYIREFKANFSVVTEVGSKDASKIYAPYIWVEKIQSDLNAGAEIVITEARESGSAGVFQSSGEVRSDLIDEILHAIPQQQLLFEAPRKDQQVWFIQLLGANVNLGNISSREIIGLETLRRGLRGDTFHTFLP